MQLHYLLDTNICIYIAKQKPVGVLNRFEKLNVGCVGMSIITYGELFYGAQKSQFSKKAIAFLEELVSLIPPLPLSTDVTKYYGEVRSKLEKQGKPIGNNDLWIASHALAMKLTLVTNNVKEFSRVSKLKLENWVDEAQSTTVART
jgi:tRNA(fMet)-specific endonuclease VapC